MIERRFRSAACSIALLGALVLMLGPLAGADEPAPNAGEMITAAKSALIVDRLLFAELDESLDEHLAREWDPRAGEEIYYETCVACHGEDGAGVIPGMPDFTRQDGVLTQADDVLMEHIENGFESPGSVMAMPAKGGIEDLTMDDIMNVLDYMHKKFHYKVEF